MVMDKSEIKKEIRKLTNVATERMEELGDIYSLPNHTTFDFLTEEEQDRLWKLKKMLPSRGEEIQNAKERIKERIKNRKK